MARIRVETEFHEFYRVLASDDEVSSRRKTFGTMKDVFMLAVAFGVATRSRAALGPSREIFPDTTLRQHDWDAIKAAVLAEGESQFGSIGDEEHLIRVAEEYANAGIRILRKEYLSTEPEESLAAALLQLYQRISVQ